MPVDFEVESVAARLHAVGLSSGPTFISWLGVIHYLSLEAIAATLRGLPPCALAVTYITPEDTWHGDIGSLQDISGDGASSGRAAGLDAHP